MCSRLGSFQWNEARFSYLLAGSVWILIFGLKSVAAKAATAATVPTPLHWWTNPQEELKLWELCV